MYIVPVLMLVQRIFKYLIGIVSPDPTVICSLKSEMDAMKIEFDCLEPILVS